jgi:hypothetical protein
MAKMSREGGVKELKSQKERKVENKKDTLWFIPNQPQGIAQMDLIGYFGFQDELFSPQGIMQPTDFQTPPSCLEEFFFFFCHRRLMNTELFWLTICLLSSAVISAYFHWNDTIVIR